MKISRQSLNWDIMPKTAKCQGLASGSEFRENKLDKLVDIFLARDQSANAKNNFKPSKQCVLLEKKA